MIGNVVVTVEGLLIAVTEGEGQGGMRGLRDGPLRDEGLLLLSVRVKGLIIQGVDSVKRTC